MTEVLTESFCERCGTRYTFETAQQRARPLSRITTLGRGLRHFVVQGDSSFDEAMAVARSEQEQRATTAQLEAFHRTFNFCLSCRQYTCRECWNAVEGRCLSCAPMPVEETLAPAAMVEASTAIATAAAAPAAPAEAAAVEQPAAPPESPEPAPAAVAEPEPDSQPIVEAAAVAETDPQPIVDGGSVSEREPQPIVEAAAVAEPEPQPIPEPAAAVEAEPQREPEPEPKPDAAAADVDVAAFPGFQPGRSLDDEIAAYEIRIAALSEIPLDPGPAIADPAPAQVVASASRPDLASESLPVVGSATELEARRAATAVPGTCRSCGLSISASARFCRRCGTRQAA